MFLGVITGLGVLVFLYITWRNLYDNYQDDKLISYSWLALLIMLLVGRMVFVIQNWSGFSENIADWFRIFAKPGYNYVGGLAGLWLFSIWYADINNWKFWPFLEDLTPSVFILLSFLAGEEYVRSGYHNSRYLLSLLIAVGGYLMANFISGRYRSLQWYKSGKKGFVFFFVNMVAAMVMMAESVLYKDSLFVIVLYLAVSLIFMAGLFMLGQVLTIFNFGRRK